MVIISCTFIISCLAICSSCSAVWCEMHKSQWFLQTFTSWTHAAGPTGGLVAVQDIHPVGEQLQHFALTEKKADADPDKLPAVLKCGQKSVLKFRG